MGRAGTWITAIPVDGRPPCGPSRPALRNAACRNARALGVSFMTIGREPCSCSAAMSMSTTDCPVRVLAVRCGPVDADEDLVAFPGDPG